MEAVFLTASFLKIILKQLLFILFACSILSTNSLFAQDISFSKGKFFYLDETFNRKQVEALMFDHMPESELLNKAIKLNNTANSLGNTSLVSFGVGSLILLDAYLKGPGYEGVITYYVGLFCYFGSVITGVPAIFIKPQSRNKLDSAIEEFNRRSFGEINFKQKESMQIALRPGALLFYF